jgi:hypothetical protein
MVSRRGFIGMMVGGIAAQAAVRTFPFRVFSFPTEIIRRPHVLKIGTGQLWMAPLGKQPVFIGSINDFQITYEEMIGNLASRYRVTARELNHEAL